MRSFLHITSVSLLSVPMVHAGKPEGAPARSGLGPSWDGTAADGVKEPQVLGPISVAQAGHDSRFQDCSASDANGTPREQDRTVLLSGV